MMDMYVIECCRNCPRALIDLEQTEKTLRDVFAQADFSRLMSARVQDGRPLHHQIFRASVSGCPNSCSQPQIKDFGVQGQLVPEVGEDCNGCGLCAEACPDGCIDMSGDLPVINREECLNCGKCIKVCPAGAMQSSGQGYRIMLGGKLGRRPRLATLHLALADEAQLAKSLLEALDLLLKHGRPGERLGQVLDT